MKKFTLTNRHQKGFSLIEILIVVVIIGVLAALALVNISKYRKSLEADTVASDLSQLIRRTRENAVSRRITYRLMLKSSTFVAGVKGDDYVLEEYRPGVAMPITQNFSLPKGWRFGRIDTVVPANLPRGLNDIFGMATSCSLIFKGDGSIANGNDSRITSPTSNVILPPINGNIFIYDSEEGDQVAKNYKPRAINVIGATGRTGIWKLFKDEWKLPF